MLPSKSKSPKQNSSDWWNPFVSIFDGPSMVKTIASPKVHAISTSPTIAVPPDVARISGEEYCAEALMVNKPTRNKSKTQHRISQRYKKFALTSYCFIDACHFLIDKTPFNIDVLLFSPSNHGMLSTHVTN